LAGCEEKGSKKCGAAFKAGEDGDKVRAGSTLSFSLGDL